MYTYLQPVTFIFPYDRPQQSLHQNHWFGDIFALYLWDISELVRVLPGVPQSSPCIFGRFMGGELLKNIFEKKVGFQIFFQGHQKLMHLLLISLYKTIEFIKEISGNAPRKKQSTLSSSWEGVGGSYSVVLKYSIVLQNHQIWTSNSSSARR